MEDEIFETNETVENETFDSFDDFTPDESNPVLVKGLKVAGAMIAGAIIGEGIKRLHIKERIASAKEKANAKKKARLEAELAKMRAAEEESNKEVAKN